MKASVTEEGMVDEVTEVTRVQITKGTVDPGKD